MSDREDSPQRSGSRSPSHSSSPKVSASAKSSPKASRSRSRSRERSFSRSRSRSYKRNSYRSRSRSRSRRHYSRSRSRSPYSHRRPRRSRYSRSRSRSYSPYYNRRHSPYYGGSGYSDRRRGYYRSHSRSPMSNRRRHVGSRDNPKTSRCIGIFGLSLYTQERDLRDVFSRYGPIEEVQVVYDHQTGRSRGFAFVYFRSHEDAAEAKEAAAGTEIDGRRIRVDYSITERAHTPTPGIYLGKPTTSARDRGGRGGYGRRSPSPYVSSRRGSRYSRSRSRSRSYSPRRY